MLLRFLPNDEYQAAIGANAPSAVNPFATIADIGGSASLSAVLAVGNTTGANDISINTGQSVVYNNGGFTAILSEPTLTGNVVITLPTINGALASLSNKLSDFSATTSAELFSNISDETGGTGVLVGSISPIFGTDITTPKILGGSAVGSQLTLQSTSANGTDTVAGIRFLVDNNGSRNPLNIYNNGQVLVNSTTINPTALGIMRVEQGTSTIDMGESVAAIGTIWFSQVTPSTTNYGIRGSSSGTVLNATTTTSISVANIAKITATVSTLTFTPTGGAGAGSTPFTFTAPIATALAASTERIGYLYQLTTGVQWSTGALALQREVVIKQPSYSFVGASALTDMATFSIEGAPISNLNNTPTNTHALLIQAISTTDGTGTAPTNSYGLTVNAQIGATTNYAAQFIGGDIVFGDTVDVVLNTTTGTKWGTATTQKQAWYGATPVVQRGAITSPSGGIVVDIQARTAIDSIRQVLIDLGFTA